MGVGSPRADQNAFSVKELAEYRLTLSVFKQFDQASRLIAKATRDDPALANDPLFTRDILVLGDASVVAGQLEARLTNDRVLAGALGAANISAREYTKVALALFAARLAHGFMKTGVLRFVPAGVPTDNVAFVETYQAEIAAVLQALGVEDAPSGKGVAQWKRGRVYSTILRTQKRAIDPTPFSSCAASPASWPRRPPATRRRPPGCAL